MTLALGDMAEYLNAPLVFCGVATIDAYVRWLETKRRSWAYTSILFFLLGALSDWPIFYLVPILAAHAVLTGAAPVLRVLTIALAAALLFSALASWMLWSGGDVSVVNQFALRASTDGITLRDWIGRVVIHHQGMLHTWPVLVLSGIWVLHLTRQRLMGRLPDLPAHTIPLLLIAWGAIHLVVGAQGTYWHAWWSMILTPAFALMAALGVEVVIGVLPRRIRTRRVALPLAALAVILFVASSAQTAYDFTLGQWGFRGNYTLKSIGSAIREAAASTEGVLTTVNTDHPALRVYADRQLRPAIASVEALKRSLGAGPYVAFYGYEQRSGPPPTWFVMPVSDQAQLPELTATLDARYPRREMNGVVVYRLRP